MMTFFSARELTITHIAPAVAIVEPDGLVRTLQPDGEKYQAEHSEGEVKTRWKGDRLVVETKTERGTTKETWIVSPQTGQLTVRLELGGGRMPKVEVDRVYDPVEQSSSGYAGTKPLPRGAGEERPAPWPKDEPPHRGLDDVGGGDGGPGPWRW